MGSWDRIASPLGGRRAIAALGCGFVALAVGWGLAGVGNGTAYANVLFVSAMIGAPGALLVYGARWLARTDIAPAFYPVVFRWCLAGLGAMLGVLAVYHVQPADSISNPARAALSLTSLSTLAGFVVGTYDARSKTSAREVERRNRELQRTRAQLERTVDRLEGFTYAASHDLQEPLRMVSSYLLLLERRHGEDLDAEAEEFLTFALDGADRMRELIDALFEYSRVEGAGRPFEPVDLDAVVANALADLDERIEASDAEVLVEELPTVEGDERQLRLVFRNLLSNALEYSGDGSPRVAVTAADTGASWTISVSDEGVGIDPDDADRVFDVFERLHDRAEHSGAGLGLALCRRIVERHGGEIRVDSVPGEGSTFSVTLPRADDREAHAASGRPTEARKNR